MAKDNISSLPGEALQRRRRIVETTASCGLLILAIGLVAPFATGDDPTLLLVFRIIFSIGALMYAVSRAIPVNSPDDSKRLRSLRRMEFWAGAAFIIAAAFWWYNSARFSAFPFTLAVMRDVVAFTMAGAVIQIIASWMIAFRMRKEAGESKSHSDNTK